jgi:Transposase DDE domain group 1
LAKSSAKLNSDAGVPLLGATNGAIGLVPRLARCFTDGRAPELVEHTVETMLMQRVCGITLGTRTSSIMTSCATIRCRRPSLASLRQ